MMEIVRRRAFVPGLVVAALAAGVFVGSLFRIEWYGAGQSARVSLNQGAVRVWAGSVGDFVAISPGLHVGGWSGVGWWKPEVDAAHKFWIQAAPMPAAGFPGGVVPAKRITVLNVVVPLYIPLLGLLLMVVTSFPAYRRHRRASRGLCRGCGYDLRGLGARCPECGEAIRRLVALAGRLVGNVRIAIMGIPPRTGLGSR